MGIFVDLKRPYPDGAARWVTRIHTDEGKPRYQESRTRTEAELFVVRHGGRRNFHLRRTMCLGTAIVCFLQGLPEDLDPKTVGMHNAALRLSLLAVLRIDTVFSSITADDYRKALAHLQCRGLSGETIYHRFCMIRRFAADAVYWGFAATEPVTDILGGIDRSRTKCLAVVPTDNHLKLIRSVCGPRTRLILSLMTCEGMEPSELDRALRSDIDFSADTIFIRHLANGVAAAETPPGRFAPLSAQTRLDALRWLATSPGGANDPLFTGNSPDEFYYCLTRAQRQVGLVREGRGKQLLPFYLPKYFSHYAAQTRAQQGMDLLTLTETFGYDDIGTLHRRVGYIVEAKAHADHDRALIRSAKRSV
jgi:site-specific recombinase XerC